MVLLPMSSSFSRGLHFCRMRRTTITMDGFCLLYLLMILLMRSGDVETNPGPNTAESPPDEQRVTDADIVQLASLLPPYLWYSLCNALRIRYSTAEGIRQHYREITEQYIHLLQIWKATSTGTRKDLNAKLIQIDAGGLVDNFVNHGQTSSQTHGINDVIINVANSIYDDGDIRRFGLALGIPTPVIHWALQQNWAGDIKTSHGSVIMIQDWAETVESSEIIPTLRTALKRAGLEVEETCFTYSSRGSVDLRTNSSLQRNAVASTQRSAPPYQASNDSPSGSFQRPPKFYDIYLMFSQDTVHVHKVKDIIRRNDWTMMTANDSRLGVPKMIGIEDALKTCSHVVLIITKEDCEKDAPYQTMIMGMAFQSTGRSLNGRVILIRCCEESHLPLSLQSWGNAFIDDPYLEEKLKRTIDVSIRKKQEGSSVEVILSQPGNPSSREMTAHTGPSTTASAGISSQDASADGAASSSKASKHVDPGISEMELHDLAEKLGNHTNLHTLALKLGFSYERWMQVKTSNTRRDGRICSEGTLDMLIDWKNNTLQVSQKALLNKALKDAGFAEFADDTDNDEGNGGQLTSFKHDSGSDQDDISFGGLSAPPEILARGLRAQQAYAEAAKAGTKKVYRTRLMLVGQERVGKTSLKKTLTGQGFDKNEAITDGVETANTCEISIEDAKTGEKMWSIPQKRHGNEDKKDDEYSIALADEIAKKLKMTPPQDQESLEPHSDTTLSRGLNPEETEDKYQKTLAEEIAQRPTVTPPQDQEGLGPHSDTTLVGKGLNLVETEESVLNNVESPKAKEDDNNMPNQIASLVEKTLKEQVHLKEKGTDSTDSGRGEGVSLSIWDFAGHDVYYTTHQVFLAWRAIYVIVFDLSRSLDSVVPPESRDEHYETAKGGAKSELTCLEFINFWLCSILAHAVAPSSKTPQKSPPIFIVGTHRESVKGDAKEKKRKIDSAFKKIRNSIKKKPFECHVVRKYYAIENSFEDKDKELILLKRHIEEVAMEEPYMGEEIPLRWLLFEKLLAKVDSKYMSLDQTKVLMQPIGINSERELLTMLTFYHDLGYVVYYGGIEDQQSLLRDMVILNPQWLIDVFKQVITILDPAEMFQNRSFNDAWTTLEDDGILEDRLIQHMWHNLDHQEALVQLMAKFDLICEAPVERLKKEQQDGIDAKVSNETEKVVKKRYFVPSRLTSHCSPEEIAQTKSTDFYVDFKGFLPDGLFHRLMARAVRWMDDRDGQPVNLFYRQIRLMVDEEHHAFLEMLPPPEANIKVTVFRGLDPVSDDDQPPEPSAVKEVMDFVTSTLVSLKQHWAKGIKYDVCILCPCSSPRCREKKLFEDCLKRKSLTCGIYNISTDAIKSKFGMSEEGVESGNKIPVMPKGSILATQVSIADDLLVKLAEDIETSEQMEALGRTLGFRVADINRYTETNRIEGWVTCKGTRCMLFDWRQTVEPCDHYRRLKQALYDAKLVALADTHLKRTPSIPVMATQESIADELLFKLAEDIETSEQMEALGRVLGFKMAAINKYTDTNHIGDRVTCKGTRCMLFDWRQTVEPCDQHRRLKQALYDAKLVVLADTHLKRTPSIPACNQSTVLSTSQRAQEYQ